MSTYSKNQRLLFGALAVWTVAWLLPSYFLQITGAGSNLYGWQCYRSAALNIDSYSRQGGGLIALLKILSPWTNFLIPIAILSLDRARPGSRLRRGLPALLIGSGLVNLSWLSQIKDLRIGYYLWLAGFLALGFVISTLLREEGADPRSPFYPDRPGAGSHALPRLGAIAMIIALFSIVLWAVFS